VWGGGVVWSGQVERAGPEEGAAVVDALLPLQHANAPHVVPTPTHCGAAGPDQQRAHASYPARIACIGGEGGNVQGVRHEGQVAVLLTYLHRFLEAFGPDILIPWLEFILQPSHLHSNDLRLRCSLLYFRSLIPTRMSNCALMCHVQRSAWATAH
jgi:hypothetical protein